MPARPHPNATRTTLSESEYADALEAARDYLDEVVRRREELLDVARLLGPDGGLPKGGGVVAAAVVADHPSQAVARA